MAYDHGMVTFDTLKASHRLRDAGFEEQKADALVNAFAEDIGANLATKDDIALLRKEMAGGFSAVRQEIDALRKDTDKEFVSVRQEMASGFAAVRQEMASEFAAVRNEMALREERMNARLDRQTTRLTLLAAGLAGLILTAIGIATGVLATL